jgi:hypothetical protein
MGLVFAEFLLIAGLALAIADKIITSREPPGNRYGYTARLDEATPSRADVGGATA